MPARAPPVRAVALALVVAAVLLCAPPARAARVLVQVRGCGDLVPGGSQTTAEVAAGDSAIVASFQDVSSVYIVASARDDDSAQGPSQFAVELWNDDSNEREAAQTANAAGCTTTPVIDLCPTPAAVNIRLRCLNSDRPCRVRLAAYSSRCLQDAAVGRRLPPPRPPGQRGEVAAPGPSSGISDSSSSSAGSSSKTWIIVGAVCGAAALVAGLLIYCCCCRNRRASGGDLESGTHYQQPIPPRKQQFVVSTGAQQQQQGYPVKPQQLPPAAVDAAGGAGKPGAAQAWAFAYKVASQRLTFATDASRHSGVLQRWTTIDAWLHAVMLTGQRWQGCLLYNDDPPTVRPDGNPTGYPRPVQYKTCGHTKGVVVWDRSQVGWLVHSVPKWPCHEARSPSGVGKQLSQIQDSQTDKGQSFLWVLLPAATLPTVLRQVLHMQPLVYYASDRQVWSYQPKDYTQYSGGGMQTVALSAGLWHVAKANEPELDFYQRLAQQFGGRWLVRTNQQQNRGEAGKCASNATVANITTLRVPGLDRAPYKAGSEHAKLAVCVGMRGGDNPPRPLVMVGDLNHTVPQSKRGGGGIVVQHLHLNELLRLMAVDTGTP